MTIENLVRNAFLDNMKDDWVAVAANGHPIARATTEAAVRQAAPDAAHYLTAKDLEPVTTGAAAFDRDNDGHIGGSLKHAPEPHPVSAGLDAVVAQGEPTAKTPAAAEPTAKTPEHKVPTAKTPEHKHPTAKK